MNNKYKPLHLKYRPSNFKFLLGQNHIISHFTHCLKYNRLAFAYLFTGKHGTGKTSLALLLAKCLNCLNKNPNSSSSCNKCINCINIDLGYSFDVYEINSAKTTGVENIRELLEKITFAPLNTKYKFCIFDEAHMLSTSAFNCLLKILENPPVNTVFIFLTTNPHKIPKTIISMCQKILFNSLNNHNIAITISTILLNENYYITDKALRFLLKEANGSVRDALNLLEPLYLKNPYITLDTVEVWTNVLPCSFLDFLLTKILDLNSVDVLLLIEYLKLGAWEPKTLYLGLLNRLNEKIRLHSLSNNSSMAYSVTKFWSFLLTKTESNFSDISLLQFINWYLFIEGKASQILKKKTLKKPSFYVSFYDVLSS